MAAGVRSREFGVELWSVRRQNLLTWLSGLTGQPLSPGSLAMVGLGRSLAPSPSMLLSSPKIQNSIEPKKKLPSLVALKSPPDLWNRAGAAQGTPGSLGGGHSWDRIPGREPEPRLPGSQSPSVPDHSVLCSRLPHTFLPSFLSFQAGPRWGPDKSQTNGGCWGRGAGG